MAGGRGGDGEEEERGYIGAGGHSDRDKGKDERTQGDIQGRRDRGKTG